MKTPLNVILLLLALLAAGCSESPSQLLETARFEEKQNNIPHAVQLYERIISKHAASPEAAVARERLLDLKKPK